MIILIRILSSIRKFFSGYASDKCGFYILDHEKKNMFVKVILPINCNALHNHDSDILHEVYERIDPMINRSQRIKCVGLGLLEEDTSRPSSFFSLPFPSRTITVSFPSFFREMVFFSTDQF